MASTNLFGAGVRSTWSKPWLLYALLCSAVLRLAVACGEDDHGSDRFAPGGTGQGAEAGTGGHGAQAAAGGAGGQGAATGGSASCPEPDDPMDDAITSSLYEHLLEGQATVVNLELEPLPNFSTSGSTDYAVGGWGWTQDDLFYDGSVAGAASFFLLPPNDTADATMAVFASLETTAAVEYLLTAKVGLRDVAGNSSDGVVLDVVAAASPDQDAGWQILSSLELLPGATHQLRVPLGLWPLRPGFQLTLQVRSAQSNEFGVVLIDDALVEPVQARPRLGVNYTHLTEFDDAAIARAMQQMASVGVRQVRVALLDTSLIDNAVTVLEQAASYGITVMFAVPQIGEDYADPVGSLWQGGPEFGATCGWDAGYYPLSLLDVDRYRERLTAYVEAIESRGLAVDAYEIGNELDWACTNTDIPLSGPMPAESLEATTRAYGEMLKASYEVIHDPARCDNPKVITFGASNNVERITPEGSGVIWAHEFLSRLRSFDGSNYLELYADGIGAHLYLDTETNLAVLEADLAAAGVRMPFWITEWGVPVSSPPDPVARYLSLRATLESFHSMVDMPIVWSQLYSFDHDPWRVFDTDAGEPMLEAALLSAFEWR